MNYSNLTLSDFASMPLMTREDGSRTPIFISTEGREIGLVGFKGDPNASDYEIREAAFIHYNQLIEYFNTIIDSLD